MSYTIKLTEEEVLALHGFSVKALNLFTDYPESFISSENIQAIKTIGSIKVKTEKLVNLINDDAN